MLLTILGLIIGGVAGVLLLKVLPDSLERYKQLIFFSTLIIIGGTINFIGGTIAGRRG